MRPCRRPFPTRCQTPLTPSSVSRSSVTAAIAIAAVFVTQIPLDDLREQPEWARILTVLGVSLLFGAAVSFFQYTHELNKLRLKIVGQHLAPEIGGAAAIWAHWVRTSLRGE